YWHNSTAQHARPITSAVVTVAQSQPADFRSIKEAVAAAGPGTLVRVLDDSVYQGPLRFNEPDRLRDVTIEATNGALLEGVDGRDPVVTIEHTAGVVLRGLRIRARDQQHGVLTKGPCQGRTMERV